jgi:hypothetical protein
MQKYDWRFHSIYRYPVVGSTVGMGISKLLFALQRPVVALNCPGSFIFRFACFTITLVVLLAILNIRHANALLVKKWCIKSGLWHSIESRIRKCNKMRYFLRKKVCTHHGCNTRSAKIKIRINLIRKTETNFFSWVFCMDTFKRTLSFSRNHIWP